MVAQTCYRICNWNTLFETSESRKRVSALPWVAIPTKHDGKGYRRLMREFGPAVYGAWILITAVAAKCEPRGTLIDDGAPLTALDIADKTDCPVAVIEQTLQAVTSDRIKWMELVSIDDIQQIDIKSAETPARPSPTGQDRTGHNKTGPVPVAGVFSKQEDRGGRISIFAKLTDEDLRDDQTLADWFRVAANRSDPVIAPSEVNLLNVFGAAVRALKPGRAKKGPVALFANIVRGARWGEITQSEEESARQRITQRVKEIAGLNGGPINV